VMGASLRLLGVPTDAPTGSIVAPDQGADVQEET
jgi:hypothetical protein